MSISEAASEDGSARPAANRWLRWALLGVVLLVVGVGWAFLPLGEWLDSFARWVHSFGALGMVAFVAVYALTTLLIIPGVPMTIAAGVAYGWWGVPLVLVSALIGSVLAFVAARHWFTEQISSFADRQPKLRAAVEAVNEESWTVLALMRLSPVLPFNVQNYLLGLTGLSFSSFIASTTAGMIPGAVLYTYIGILGVGAGDDTGNSAKWALLIIGLVATVVVTTLISRRARAKLAARSRAAI